MQAKDAPQFQKRLAVFDVGGMWHSIYRRQCADLVTASCHPEQARNRAVTAMQYGIFPRASKFCFLKLPIVFGYAVPFTAISKKQNRKGSPTSLIYPYIGKVASFFDKTVLCLWQGTSDSYEIPPAAVLLRTVHRGRCISKCKLLLCRCMHLAFSAKLRRARR
jgi:hypothetical protein